VSDTTAPVIVQAPKLLNASIENVTGAVDPPPVAATV
jgi:hypothetical protein